MIRTVIFDLDGVVVNSEPVHQRLENRLYLELGLDIPPDLKKALVGTSSRDAWKLIIEKYSLDRSPEELIELGRGRYLEEVRKGKVPLIDGVLDLIQRLRENGFRLMMASSASSRTIREVLKWNHLDAVFRLFIGGDEVSHSKPDPEIFLKIAERGGVNPIDCLVIEDAANGVVAARKAGMFCIGFQSHYTGDQDLAFADTIVTAMDEITIDLIRSIGNS